MANDPTPERIAYLPPKAARARKLILRSQLGLPWMLTAALFGAVILVAGAVLLAKDGRPGAPWVRVAPLTRLPDGAVTQAPGPSGQVVVVDRRGGALRAFALAPGACPVVGTGGGGFARPCAGQAWDRAGRPASGGPAHSGRPGATPAEPPAMRPLPAQVARGDLYVDPRAP